MTKKNISNLCFIISIILIIAFLVKDVIDYSKYLTSFGSAPFSLWIAVNALFMLIPAMILMIVGFILKKK